MENTVLEKFHQGRQSLGTFSAIDSPLAVESLRYTGLDYVIVDTEHSPAGIESAAAQIAAAMGVHAIHYGLSCWKGVLCSTCELFTDKAYAYLPIGHLVSKGGMGAARAYYEKMGDKFVNALNEMLVFDAVICNVDRHFGNFGVMVDNRTNTIVSPAPLFDHGNSLFNFAGADAWADEAALEAYIETLYPSVYDDFLGTAKAALTPELREKLRHLLNFKFKKHSRYNLPENRLRMVERQVQKRAKLLLSV